jgi:hypothetical protein
MKAQQQANQYYKAAFDRWALELSYEKNHLIAKSIASYVVEQILKVVDNPDETYLMKYSVNYWVEVLEEVNKIRGYDNNIHDANDSTNS